MAKRTKRKVSVNLGERLTTKPLPPVRAWAVADMGIPYPGILVYSDQARIAGSRKALRCRNSWNKIVPVIIADARYYRVVRKPLPRKRGGR